MRDNDALTELDISSADLQIPQLGMIFRALATTISLAYLNVSFNTIEYSRFPE